VVAVAVNATVPLPDERGVNVAIGPVPEDGSGLQPLTVQMTVGADSARVLVWSGWQPFKSDRFFVP